MIHQSKTKSCEHKKNLVYHCQDCNMEICSNCRYKKHSHHQVSNLLHKLTSSPDHKHHSMHQKVSIEDLTQENDAELTEFKRSIQSRFSEYRNFMTFTQNQVNDFFDKEIAKIQEIREAVINQGIDLIQKQKVSSHKIPSKVGNTNFSSMYNLESSPSADHKSLETLTSIINAFEIFHSKRKEKIKKLMNQMNEIEKNTFDPKESPHKQSLSENTMKKDLSEKKEEVKLKDSNSSISSHSSHSSKVEKIKIPDYIPTVASLFKTLTDSSYSSEVLTFSFQNRIQKSSIDYIFPKFCSSVQDGHDLYITGGENPNGSLAEIKIAKKVNIEKTTLKNLPQMNIAKCQHGMVFMKNYLITIGGFNSQESSISQCEVFSPENEKWSFIAHLNERKQNCSVCTFQGTTIFAFGGVCIDKENFFNSKNIEYINIASKEQKWNQYIPLNKFDPIPEMGCFQIGNDKIVLGGGSLEQMSSSSYILEVSKNKFDKISSLGQPDVFLNSSAQLIQGKFYIFGNLDYSVHSFDPTTMKWKVFKSQEFS